MRYFIKSTNKEGHVQFHGTTPSLTMAKKKVIRLLSENRIDGAIDMVSIGTEMQTVFLERKHDEKYWRDYRS